jgi:hypothetical protein
MATKIHILRTGHALLGALVIASGCMATNATAAAQSCSTTSPCSFSEEYQGSFTANIIGNVLYTDGSGTTSDPTPPFGLSNVSFSDDTDLTSGNVYDGSIALSDGVSNIITGVYTGFLDLSTGDFSLALTDLIGSGILAGDVGTGTATGAADLNADLTGGTFDVTVDATMVPEPTSLALLASSLVMIGGARLRRRSTRLT